MGCDIHGWIEATHYNDNTSWHGIVRLNGFSTRYYRTFARLFGVRNENNYWQPIAAGRGFPAKVSWEVEDELTRQKEWFDSGDYHSFTWITFNEFSQIKEETDLGLPVMDGDWPIIYDLFQTLVNHYGHDQVKMVVWFDN